MKNLRILPLALLTFSLALPAFAESEIKEDAKEAAHDVKRGAKKAGRAVKDKTCEMVNGKMECAGKKLKNKAQNTMDKAEDAVD